ncbi:hypothetical protein FQN53_006320 [Emmonsiellopsis sp. PD_33]|nr:hypothetical protein FQN53_006320 [Emmonsiellopsis sp. PD_33]
MGQPALMQLSTSYLFAQSERAPSQSKYPRTLTLRSTSILLPANVNNAAVTPYNRQHRINANSFQQNTILSYNGWQYAAFYHEANKDTIDGSPRAAFVVNIRRRQSSETWETLMFKDYEQTADDGHNTISIGICEGDGTVHVSFDMHCDPPDSDSESPHQDWQIVQTIFHGRMNRSGLYWDSCREWEMTAHNPKTSSRSLPIRAFSA